MKTYSIVFSPNAECDLLDIKANTFSLFKNEDAALNFIKGLLNFIETLSFFPNRFSLNSSNKKVNGIRRKTSIQHYNIYYKVDDEPLTVVVERIIHCKKKQPKGLCDIISDLSPDGIISLSEILQGMSEEECFIYLQEMVKRK